MQWGGIALKGCISICGAGEHVALVMTRQCPFPEKKDAFLSQLVAHCVPLVLHIYNVLSEYTAKTWSLLTFAHYLVLGNIASNVYHSNIPLFMHCFLLFFNRLLQFIRSPLGDACLCMSVYVCLCLCSVWFNS